MGDIVAELKTIKQDITSNNIAKLGADWKLYQSDIASLRTNPKISGNEAIMKGYPAAQAAFKNLSAGGKNPSDLKTLSGFIDMLIAALGASSTDFMKNKKAM